MLIVLLVGYVVHRVNPGHFRLSASILKLLSLNIEVTGKTPQITSEPSADEREGDDEASVS
jgi:hypothetical protein